MKAVRSFTVRPLLPEPIAALDRLAGNLRWAWHRETRHVFASIDPDLWVQTGHDPRRVLAAVPTSRLVELAGDGGFCERVAAAEAVPQYSGGLGILAGDHLKSTSDLGVPLVGVGLFYRHGYFRQSVSVDGWQQERFPDLDPYAMSMELVDGVRVELDLAGERLIAQVWRADVGRTPLFL